MTKLRTLAVLTLDITLFCALMTGFTTHHRTHRVGASNVTRLGARRTIVTTGLRAFMIAKKNSITLRLTSSMKDFAETLMASVWARMTTF